jgi:hypothetical protein
MIGDRESEHIVASDCRSVQHATGYCRPQSRNRSSQVTKLRYSWMLSRESNRPRLAILPSTSVWLYSPWGPRSLPCLASICTLSAPGRHVVSTFWCMPCSKTLTFLRLSGLHPQRKKPQRLADTPTPTKPTKHQDYISSLDPSCCL